ncbi:unnamed protein product, partial [Sphacelaria rigidula]
ARTEARSKELIVATWNVRTMTERDFNGTGHAEDLLLFASNYNCDFVALQETRRDGRTTFHAPAAGYLVHCSGYCHGDGGNPRMLGIGLAIKESTANTLGLDAITPEHVSARVLKVRAAFRHRVATTFIVGYAPTETAQGSDKTTFWKTFCSSIAEVPANEHQVLMMDATARTGKREVEGMGDARLLGEYGRDTRNDNGRRLLKCAAENKMVITNTFFRTPTRGESSTAYTYAGPKVEHRGRLNYILVRQQDRRLVQNVTVHPEMKSDHRLVSAAIRFRGRNAPNRQPQPRGGDRGVRFDRQALASDRSWRATPSTVEAKQTVGKLADGKAVGTDDICGALLKLGRTEDSIILKCLHDIVLTVWRQELVPQEWKDTIIKVLIKKQDPYECGNYRGISLGSHASKVVLKIV